MWGGGGVTGDDGRSWCVAPGVTGDDARSWFVTSGVTGDDARSWFVTSGVTGDDARSWFVTPGVTGKAIGVDGVAGVAWNRTRMERWAIVTAAESSRERRAPTGSTALAEGGDGGRARRSGDDVVVLEGAERVPSTSVGRGSGTRGSGRKVGVREPGRDEGVREPGRDEGIRGLGRWRVTTMLAG